MAEVLGVVASGLSVGSFAIQVVDSVQKLRNFWNSIKDAPDNIKALLEELDTLGRIIILEDQGQASSEARLHCQSAASKVTAVVKDLEGVFGTAKRARYWAKVKAALEEKKLEKCLKRLERAKLSLILAKQCYFQ